MKRITTLSLSLAFGLAAVVGCSKSADKPMAETTPDPVAETTTETTTEVAGTSEMAPAKVLVLKFHHDN